MKGRRLAWKKHFIVNYFHDLLNCCSDIVAIYHMFCRLAIYHMFCRLVCYLFLSSSFVLIASAPSHFGDPLSSRDFRLPWWVLISYLCLYHWLILTTDLPLINSTTLLPYNNQHFKAKESHWYSNLSTPCLVTTVIRMGGTLNMSCFSCRRLELELVLKLMNPYKMSWEVKDNCWKWTLLFIYYISMLPIFSIRWYLNLCKCAVGNL